MEPYDGHSSEVLFGVEAHQRECLAVERVDGVDDLDRVHG
jgi:hypothetical protein